MGIANSVKVSRVDLKEDERCAHFIADSTPSKFEYDIICKSPGFIFLFNVKTMKMAILIKNWPLRNASEAAFMSFSIRDELPVPQVNWIFRQPQIIEGFSDSFKDQYATYLLDNIINT